MNILNTPIDPTINGMCITLYTKDFDRIVFYCAAISHTDDGRSRFYIRDVKCKTCYRIVLKDSDFRLVHAFVWHGGRFKVQSGYLVDLTEFDYKLIHDVAANVYDIKNKYYFISEELSEVRIF